MAYCSVYEEIIFVEGESEYIENKGSIEYKKDSFYNQQMKSLYNIKHQFAEKAKAAGANAIIHFKYGQKNTTWFRAALLAFDDNVKWYGSGDMVVISKEERERILEKIKNY